jgi:hypothetical protein
MKVTTWLTAGATTVGVGAALLSGAAIANAKPSSASSSSASSSSSSHSSSSSGASSHKSHKSHQHSPKTTDSGSSSGSDSSGGSSNSGSSGGSGSDSGSGSGGSTASSGRDSTGSAAAGSSGNSGSSTTSAADKTTKTKTAKAKHSNNKHAKTDTEKKSVSTATTAASHTSSDTSTGKHAKPANKHVAAAATDAADTSTTTAADNGASGSSSTTAASALAAVSASATTASSTTTTGGTSTVKTTGTRSADFSGVLSVLAAVGQALSVSARNTELTLAGYVHNTELTLSHDLTGTAKTVNAAVTSLAAAVESLTHTSTASAAATSTAATSTAVAGTANPAAGTDTDADLYAGTSSDPQVAQALTEIQQAQAAYKAAAKTGNWWVNFCNSMSARYLSGALNRLTTYQEKQDDLLAAYTANPTTKNYNALMANEKLTTTAYSNLKTAASWSKIADVKTYATAASADAHIYGTVSMGLYLGTESIVKISINGGPMVKVLLDSGSTGLVIASKYVGNDATMTTTGSGTSAYGTGSGDTGVTFDYTTYTTSVSFGSGITGDSVTVNVVSAGTQSAFLKYIGQDGVVGVLGIGTNAVDNQVPVTAGLTGELGNGVYINEKTKTVTFGPNPLPVKVTASGTPNSTGYISVDGGTTLTPANFILDTGGVYGTITAGAAGDAATSTGYLAVGTVVSVYNSAGDLLYSYKVTKSNSPTVTDDASTTQTTVDGVTAYAMNSGYQGFALGPVYIDYLSGTTTITDSDGNVSTYTGETDYDLWTS